MPYSNWKPGNGGGNCAYVYTTSGGGDASGDATSKDSADESNDLNGLWGDSVCSDQVLTYVQVLFIFQACYLKTKTRYTRSKFHFPSMSKAKS